MSTAIITADNLTRRFGSFVAVDHVSFTIEPGQVIGYLGPNGSGKTTTIRMLLGILQPSEGSARVMGLDTVRQAEQVRARTGYMSQKFALYGELTVAENLEFYAGLYGVRSRARLRAVLEELGLDQQAGQLVRNLSSGWRQRLALAAAIVHQPPLLLLDEPTSGVDPTARRAFWDLIYRLAAEGITILVSTHYMDEAEYCHQVGILRSGRLLALDTPTRLKQTLPGRLWEVALTEVDTLLPALERLERLAGVMRTSLSSDRLRVLAAPQITPEDLRAHLSAAGIELSEASATPLSMEDVFFSLVD
jgi:ABC-2 type transport system ATP-binding protein